MKKYHPCPRCGLLETRVAQRQDWPGHRVTLSHWRHCDNCGCIFQPHTRRTDALFRMALAAAAVALGGYYVMDSFVSISYILYCYLVFEGLRRLWQAAADYARASKRNDPKTDYLQIDPTSTEA